MRTTTLSILLLAFFSAVGQDPGFHSYQYGLQQAIEPKNSNAFVNPSLPLNSGKTIYLASIQPYGLKAFSQFQMGGSMMHKSFNFRLGFNHQAHSGTRHSNLWLGVGTQLNAQLSLGMALDLSSSSSPGNQPLYNGKAWLGFLYQHENLSYASLVKLNHEIQELEGFIGLKIHWESSTWLSLNAGFSEHNPHILSARIGTEFSNLSLDFGLNLNLSGMCLGMAFPVQGLNLRFGLAHHPYLGESFYQNISYSW